jgi:hypothetical protein
MELSKEIEEKLRHELSNIKNIIPIRIHNLDRLSNGKVPVLIEKFNGGGIKGVIKEDDSAKKHEELMVEHQEDQLLFKNFSEYLENIKNIKMDKSQENLSFPREDGQIHNDFFHMFDSDSPITMGSSEGEEEDVDNFDEEEEEFSVNHSSSYHGGKKYKKLTFKDVERSLDFHEEEENKCSNELDILITFLKGQNHLYSLSHYLTQQKINCLTIPSFIFSIVVTVLAPLTHTYMWSGILTSALTATIATLFGCVRYYELDSACSKYLLLANHYNKMQLFLETISNSLVLGTEKIKGTEWKGVVDKIHEVEAKITEIKEMNSLLPPEEIKLLIPIISHVNIFSFIKKMKMMKKNKISKYLKIKNEIRFILNQWGGAQNISSSSLVMDIIDIDLSEKKDINFGKKRWKQKQHQRIREKHRMNFLLKQKADVRKELNDYRTAYTYMDEIFTREINLADHVSHWWVLFRWFLGIHPDALPKNNPVVDKYLDFIFSSSSRSSSRSSSHEIVVETKDNYKEHDYYYFGEENDDNV